MMKKLGFGASFALTAAAIAIGCSGNSTTIVTGGGGELSTGNFPASSIASNNVAPDGGGFSENNQTASFGRFQCVFNTAQPGSDGPNSNADNSAMVMFSTQDNGSTGNREHIFLSYFSSGKFSPPVEITGQDRNDAVTPAGGTNISAALLCPLNTGSYVGANGVANSRVRTNAGDWLIVWDGNTSTQDQTLNGSSGTVGVQIASAVGVRHTIWATVFIKSLASQPIATTSLIGNTAASGTPNGTPTEMHYGFQAVGTQISPFNNGLGNGGQNMGAIPGAQAGFVTTGNAVVKPAEDIASFGAASDTFVHCAVFGSSVHDLSGLDSGGNRLGNFGGGQFHFGTTTPGPFQPASPSKANYTVGDNTSFIQLFWTQLVTSGSGLTRQSSTFAPTASPGTVQLGPTWSLVTANFNLATLTVGGSNNPAAPTGQTVVTAPARRNTTFNASTEPMGDFGAYNNLLFWNYVDVSLATAVGTTTGVFEADVSGIAGGSRGESVVLSEVAVIPGNNGDATVGNQNDITLLGAAGRHQTTNSTPPGSTSPVDVGDEFVGFQICNGCPILGPDEGQQDIVAFVVGRATTFTAHGGGVTSNIDNELWAAAFTASGANVGQLETMPNNPKRVSVGVSDLPFPTTTATAYTGMPDSVNDVKLQSSRDGTYDVLAWRQAVGTSEQANMALLATVYKVFRTVANTTSASTTIPTLDQRFPSTNPIVVNTASTVAYSTATVLPAGWTGSPVAAYDFEGHISYKCGFQGDRTKMSVLWLYSDGTEDRMFIKLLTIGTGTLVTDQPTIAASNETEIDSTAAVPAFGVNNPATGFGNLFKSSFRFLPLSFGETPPTWSANSGANFVNCSHLNNNVRTDTANAGTTSDFDSVDSVDAGVNATGGGGDVLIVFSKVVAATTNNWDRQIIGALYNQTTISDRAVLSKAGQESVGQAPGGFAGTAGQAHGFTAAYGGIPTGFKTNLYDLIPNTESASISTANRSPDNGTYIYFGGPVDNNLGAARALYTRHFRARKSTATGGTAVTFANTFFPAASASTGDATFKNPLRIDQAASLSDANYVGTLQKGRQAMVIFGQDNHFWGTSTSDGETYTNTNGLPSALLIDNNLSANQLAPGVGSPVIHVCVKTDSNCDDLSGTIVGVLKDDVNLNQRIYIRVMQ